MTAMNSVSLVIHYHQQTKHHPKRYARSLGFMDWANQPNPFRSFEGARKVLLDHPPLDSLPTYDGLFLDEKLPSQEISRSSISRIFFDSLALSAWKQARGTRPWSLRINPSSGALHPTEGYLVSGPIAGIANKPGVYHYLPYHHGLERRSGIPSETWETMAPGGIFVGLTSIYWRESWKYGERAFRYCHHDV